MAEVMAIDPIAQRRESLDSAVRKLKRHGILVDPVDRFAQVRRYRVTGIKESVLAEDVIALAERLTVGRSDMKRGGHAG